MIEKIERLEERFDEWLNNDVTNTKVAIVVGTILVLGLLSGIAS